MSRISIYKRVGYNVFVFGAVFLAPWWLWAFVCVLGMVFFPRYIEAVMAALLFDSLYAIDRNIFFGFQFFFVSASVILLFGIEYIRKKTFFS